MCGEAIHQSTYRSHFLLIPEKWMNLIDIYTHSIPDRQSLQVLRSMSPFAELSIRKSRTNRVNPTNCTAISPSRRILLPSVQIVKAGLECEGRLQLIRNKTLNAHPMQEQMNKGRKKNHFTETNKNTFQFKEKPLFSDGNKECREFWKSDVKPRRPRKVKTWLRTLSSDSPFRLCLSSWEIIWHI